MKLRKLLENIVEDRLYEQATSLLAPNGKKSNLSKNLYDFVRTDEFISWFGDWINSPNGASKIVDENGEPMIVFHGTKVKFDEFDDDKQKIGWLGKGFYFTNDKKATKEYGRSVLTIFLNVRKPFEVDGNDTNDVDYEIRKKYNTETGSDISILLKTKGYDGVIFNHWDKGNMITCFSSSQIKRV